MPQYSGRRRAPSHRHRGPARTPGRVSAPRKDPREDQRSDLDRALTAAAAAPAPAATTFRELGLPARLTDALTAGGMVAPFAIQASAIPDALAGRDVLGRAQTGSGKTLAFGLPMLARLAAAAGPRRQMAPRGLVLVPTRELAVQVAGALAPLGQRLGVSVMTVYGGVAISRQIDRLRRGIDIVVATPGRLIDLIDRTACTLGDIEITVIDEADHMADLGFLPAVTRILDATPAGGQRMLFSATLDRGVDRLVTGYLSDPALHAVASDIVPNDVDHQVFVLPAQDKVTIAAEIGRRPGRTLFFVRTKHGADRLAKQLTRAGVDAAAIHGNLNQNQRQRALTAFTAGHPRVLVATDVAARGIHVDDIGLVVHFDPPNDHKDYLHRSGRTARAGASGTVVALVEPAQVREVGRLHQAAGVTPTSHQVQPGHDAVRDVASSGTPIPVAASRPPQAPGAGTRPAARRPGGRGPDGGADSGRPRRSDNGQSTSQLRHGDLGQGGKGKQVRHDELSPGGRRRGPRPAGTRRGAAAAAS
jgi:superfamily II DNA/RNA helicase